MNFERDLWKLWIPISVAYQDWKASKVLWDVTVKTVPQVTSTECVRTECVRKEDVCWVNLLRNGNLDLLLLKSMETETACHLMNLDTWINKDEEQ